MGILPMSRRAIPSTEFILSVVEGLGTGLALLFTHGRDARATASKKEQQGQLEQQRVEQQEQQGQQQQGQPTAAGSTLDT